MLFTGGALWFGGKTKGAHESIRDRLKDIEASGKMAETRDQTNRDRLDRLDNRLTAAETNVGNQGRTLDRIEAKLDRLIESRPFQA